MGRRLELNQKLVDILGDSKRVYFQPPENIKMEYPAIVYSRDAAQTDFADDNPYRNTQRWQVTVIDQSPDNPFLEKLAALPMTLYARNFKKGQLNHDVYNVYF